MKCQYDIQDRYDQASKDIKTHSLPIASAALLHSIACHDSGGGCTSTYERLMDATGIANRRTVAKALAKLKEYGLITSHENSLPRHWCGVAFFTGTHQTVHRRGFKEQRYFYPVTVEPCDYCGGEHPTPSEPAKHLGENRWSFSPRWPEDFPDCNSHIGSLNHRNCLEQ